MVDDVDAGNVATSCSAHDGGTARSFSPTSSSKGVASRLAILDTDDMSHRAIMPSAADTCLTSRERHA